MSVSGARAAVRIWDGGGTNDKWSSPANWDGDLTAPASNDTLLFDGTVRPTPDNDLAADLIFGPIGFAGTAGPFVIGGNRITLGGDITNDSPNNQALNLAMVLNANRTVTVNGGTLTLGGVISGPTFGITKSGTGQLTLAVANTYTGATVIDGGTLAYTADNTAGAIAFGIAPTATTASANTGILDLTGANLTTTGLTVQTNSATANQITIGTGKTLTVNGGFTVGVGNIFSEGNGGANTVLSVAGNSLVVNGAANNFVVGVGRSNASTTPGADPIATLDMSANGGLNNFSYTATTGELRVGGGNVRGNLTLANLSNTITAAGLRAGDSSVSGAGNNNAGRSSIHLGGGANVLNVNSIILGEGKSGGTLDFGPTAGSGTLTIAGEAGGTSTASLQIGSSSSGTGSGDESQLFLAGHNVTVQAGNVVIGRLAGATGGNSARGNVTFDTGTFSATSLQLGVNSGGSAANGATGVFTLGGPTAGNTTATGVLNVANQFYLANRTNTNASAGKSNGTFTINGGTANISTDILDASTTVATAGANNTTLTLDGGTLNMAGHNIGTYTAPITTVNLNSGTLNNVGTISATTINLQPTLTINGAPTYQLSDGGTLNSSLTPLTLPGGGGIAGGGAVTAGSVNGDVVAGSGSRVAPGSPTTVGTLTFNNNLTLNGGSTVKFKLSDNPASGNDLVNVLQNLTLAGPVNLQIGSVGAGPQIGNTYTIFNYSGTLTGNQSNFSVAGFGSRTTFTVLPTATTPGTIQLTVGGTGPLAITWVGNVNNNWDLNTTANWKDASQNPQKFFNQDTVTFDDTSTNLNDVQLVGQLSPGSVTISANRNYKFAGSGGISGGGGLTKDLAGTLILATDSTYSGPTNIVAGTLQIGDGGTTGSIGAGDITDNGTLVFKRGAASSALAIPNVISGGGAVRQDGGGIITLSGANSFSGGLTINSGAVKLANASAGGSGGAIAVNTGGTVVMGAAVTNPITLGGGTFGTSASPLTFTGDVTTTTGTTSTFRMADPTNLPSAPGDVNEMIFTGALNGSGNLNVLSNGQDNNPDGGNGFRLRGTGAGTYSGTITVGNNIKFEVQTTSTGPFSPAGAGKIVMTAGDAALGTQLTTVTTTGGYSEFNIRNNSSGDTIIGNDISVTGSGLVVLNALGSAPAGSKTTMGNLSVGSGQEVAVYLGAAPAHVLEFPTATLNGTATFSPKKPGFGADASVGSDLSLGTISETVPSSGVVMSGLNTLILTGTNNYTGPTTVNSGTFRVSGSIANSSGVTVNGGTFDVAAMQTVKSLTINTGGTTVVNTGTLKVGSNSAAAPLSISSSGANTGKLDIKSSALVVDYAPGNETANLQSVRNQIVTGYHGGDWLGNGITSSGAAADATKAIGYAQASDILGAGGGTFQGQTADGTSVLARFTIGGDANLTGSVDFTDLVALAQNYGSDFVANPSTESWWTHGDFNYDGKVDFTDLVKLAQNYGSALPTQAIAGAPAGFEQDLAAAFAAVPEPGVVGLFGVALGAGLLRRGRDARISASRTKLIV